MIEVDEKRRFEIEEHLRTEAAYHEVGHAVMFIAVEPRWDAFVHVALTPDDKNLCGRLRRVSLMNLSPDWTEDAALAFRVFSHEFCTIIAGPMAEIKYRECSSDDDGLDLGDYLAEGFGKQGTDGDLLEVYAAAITTIGGEKALPWHNLEMLTREFLESNWESVNRVAKALLKSGRLNYDATVAAMRGLPTLPKNNWIDQQCKKSGKGYDSSQWPNLCRLITWGTDRDRFRSMYP